MRYGARSVGPKALNSSSNLNLLDRGIWASHLTPFYLCFLICKIRMYILHRVVVSIHFEHKIYPQKNFLSYVVFCFHCILFRCLLHLQRPPEKKMRELRRINKQQNVSLLIRTNYAGFCSHENEIINERPPLCPGLFQAAGKCTHPSLPGWSGVLRGACGLGGQQPWVSWCEPRKETDLLTWSRAEVTTDFLAEQGVFLA